MDNDEMYNAYASAAQRYAQMLQEKKAKEEAQKAEEAKKAAEAGKNAGPGLLFTGTSRESIRAKYVAQVLFPVLAEVVPDLIKTMDAKKNLLMRMFKGPEEYVKRSTMIEMYRALQNVNRQYFKDNWKLSTENPNEVEMMARMLANDSKRHKLMDAIKKMTGYSG